MTQRPRIILHPGAPKCGSSTLQAALSATPVLKSATGETLSYSALRPTRTGFAPVTGRVLTAGRRLSVGGYVSCPNFARGEDHGAVAQGLDRIYGTARAGHTPVISQEGWYCRAETFQELLPHWFEASDTAPVIEVLAFVRPPVDWVNSAFWQWGLWSHKTVETWIEKSNISFLMGEAFAQWAALPNVRLNLHFGGDVIATFEAAYGVRLTRPDTRNSAQSPAMIGFMQRNPVFRSSGHDVAAEFIVQRWCAMDNQPRPWALRPRHLAQIAAVLGDDTERLFGLVSPETAERVRAADARWTSSAPYYDLLARGPSYLADVTELADLYDALCTGLRAAARKSLRRADIPQAPSLQDGLAVWDGVVSHVLDQLIAADKALRLGVVRQYFERLTGRSHFKG